MRKICIFLFSAVLIFMICACAESDGRESDPSGVSNTKTAAADTTVTKAPEPTVKTTKPSKKDVTVPPNAVILDVPFIDQRKDYPTGCESVSAVMVLNYYGIDISVKAFIDKYLDKGSLPYVNSGGGYSGDNPWEVFIGNPYSQSGFGCYAPVIVNAVSKLVKTVPALTVGDLYNKSIDALCKECIDEGVPVLLWATSGMKAPKPSMSWNIKGYGNFQWVRPMHCLVLTGYSDTEYYFNDPQAGKNVAYSKKSVQAAYKGVHGQAIVITMAD